MKRSDEHEYAQYSRIRSDVSKVNLNEKEKWKISQREKWREGGWEWSVDRKGEESKTSTRER